MRFEECSLVHAQLITVSICVEIIYKNQITSLKKMPQKRCSAYANKKFINPKQSFFLCGFFFVLLSLLSKKNTAGTYHTDDSRFKKVHVLIDLNVPKKLGLVVFFLYKNFQFLFPPEK